MKDRIFVKHNILGGLTTSLVTHTLKGLVTRRVTHSLETSRYLHTYNLTLKKAIADIYSDELNQNNIYTSILIVMHL